MTIHPLTRKQRTRLGDILEKLAVGVGLATIITRDLSFTYRGWGMIVAAAATSYAIWLERPRAGRS